MNNKINYINYILSFFIAILSFLILIDGFSSNSFASYTCTVSPGGTGCCATCIPWTNVCFGAGDVVPTTCPAPEGQCSCDLGMPGYCNSYEFVSPGCTTTHQCDSCCCTLSGGTDKGCAHNSGSLDGTYESLTCDGSCRLVATGWACDGTTTGVTVKMSVLGSYIKTGTANRLRDDAADSCNGYRYSGFKLVSASMSPGSKHKVGVDAFDHDSPVNIRSLRHGVDGYCLMDVTCPPTCKPETSTTEITNCISPNGTITGLTQTLTWDATTNATKYQYKVKNPDGTQPIKEAGVSLSATVTLLGAGSWAARGVYADGSVTDWSWCTLNYTPPCTPVNAVLGTWTACPACDYGAQTATCTEGSCGGTTCSSLCSTEGGTYSGTTCTRNCSTSCPPKGYHDGAECIDDEGPDLRKIRVWGWACDKSDYSQPLTIHSYLDGTYSTGGDFIENAGLADDPGGTGIGTACGSYPNHRFNYISTASYPSGDHSVYSFAINYGSHPSGNTLLTLSPRDITCCSPTPGNLGEWSTCTAGAQTSLCTGWYCGGSCNAECIADGGTYNLANHTCTRPCLYVEGNIWSDDNDDGSAQKSEKWRNATYLSGCDTSKTHPSFYLTYTGHDTSNQITRWWCHDTYGAYYGGPSGESKNIEPEKTHTFKLSSLPPGYECDSWDYQNSLNLNEAQGTGCTTSNLMMPSSGWTNVHFKLKCQDTSWGPWSDCANGVQTRTCSNPDPICQAKYCTGSSTRPCLYVEGNIWSDDSYPLDDHTSDDNWWNPSYNIACKTSKSHPSFFLSYTNHLNDQITRWYCNSGPYYQSPIGVAANIEPEQPHTFTLSNWPDGYKPKSWVYENYLNYSETSGNWISGNFTTTSLSMPASGWTNVHWELQQEKYHLKVPVVEIPPVEDDPTPSCNDIAGNAPLDKADYDVYSVSTNKLLCSGSTSTDGFINCDIWVNEGALRIEVTKTDEDPYAPNNYRMVCPGVGSYEFTPIVEPNDGDSVTTKPVGLQIHYKPGWVSAIDSDIFANEINVEVPLGDTDDPTDPQQTPQGFAKTLINSINNDDFSLGFAFSESLSNHPSGPDKIFESSGGDSLGGNAYNLLCNSLEHDSKWLESFTFTPPSNVEVLSSLPISFSSEKIYQITGDNFNNKLDDGTFTYSITGDNDISVLYVDEDIIIPNPITTSSAGRILIVVDGSVTISKDVGTEVGSFDMSDEPNIEAGIIARDGISFESIEGLMTETDHDKPIMVSAPLISSDSISFSRDLHHKYNATMPAESAKAFNKYLYLLSSLERNKSATMLYFTGVTTFDLDWEYIY